MNKKGFVLIETIVVMSIVMISLIGIYGTYSSIVKNQSQRKFYDNINDVYRLNIIKSLLKDSFNAVFSSVKCGLIVNNRNLQVCIASFISSACFLFINLIFLLCMQMSNHFFTVL